MRYVIVCLAAATLLCGRASAQMPIPGPRPTPYGGLGLSSEQTRKIQELHGQWGPKMRQLEKTLADRRRELERRFAEYELDTGVAKRLNRQINSAQDDILDHHLKLQVELRKILTSEQFSRLRFGMERRRPMGYGVKPRPGK